MKTVDNFYNVAIEDLLSTYLEGSGYYDPKPRKLCYTLELFSNGCLTYNKLIKKIADITKQPQTDIHRIISKYIANFEGFVFEPEYTSLKTKKTATKQ